MIPLNRSPKRWAESSPEALAFNQSDVAIMYAFKDAQHDIAALCAEVERLTKINNVLSNDINSFKRALRQFTRPKLKPGCM